jgi:hypothetical protein
MVHVNMPTLDEWTALSARIRGLIEAARLAAAMLPGTTDIYGAFRLLRQQATIVFTDLGEFAATLDTSRGAAKSAIEGFVEHRTPLFTDESGTQEVRQSQARTCLVLLAALEAEVSHLLRDREIVLCNQSERAFEHLQRLIVVDASVRQQWVNAFDAGEIECEKLGAVHLLGHGIWAFKAYAGGGRTDLVYQHLLTSLDAVKRSASGLVLTEWKKLSDRGDPIQSFEKARKQAQQYARGVLGGSELQHYRYAILVSRQQVNVPADVEDAGILYRHINIAVEPKSPSKA